MSSKGKANRTKGHSYEVKVAKDLRDIGLIKTKTSRAASKLYDDCGIDHWGAILPSSELLLTQCKSGYKSNRPKADVEFANQLKKIEENFPEGSMELNPNNIQVLLHKLDAYKDTNHLVTMSYNNFLKLLKTYIDANKKPI